MSRREEPSRRVRDDHGQVFPIYLAAIIAVFALTLVLLQVGSAHVLERRAETAADASSLAAAQRLGRGIAVTAFGVEFGDQGAAYRAAGELAGSNGASVIDAPRFASAGLLRRQVSVTVETDTGVIGGPLGGVTGTPARSTSTARLDVEVQDLPGSSPRGTPAETLARRTGVSVRPDSALGQSGRCMTGVDTSGLSDEVKIAILRVEAQLDQGLELDGAYLDERCLPAAVVIPQLAPAVRGDEIRLRPTQDGLAEIRAAFADRGFCVTGNVVVAPGSLACSGDLSSLIDVRTRLVPNPDS